MFTLLCTASGFQVESYGLGEEPGVPKRKATLVVMDGDYNTALRANQQAWRDYYQNGEYPDEEQKLEPETFDREPNFSGNLFVQGESAAFFEAGRTYNVSVTSAS